MAKCPKDHPSLFVVVMAMIVAVALVVVTALVGAIAAVVAVAAVLFELMDKLVKHLLQLFLALYGLEGGLARLVRDYLVDQNFVLADVGERLYGLHDDVPLAVHVEGGEVIKLLVLIRLVVVQSDYILIFLLVYVIFKKNLP